MSGSVEVTWMGGGGECSAREVDLAGCELRLTGVETAAADELFNDKCGKSLVASAELTCILGVLVRSTAHILRPAATEVVDWVRPQHAQTEQHHTPRTTCDDIGFRRATRHRFTNTSLDRHDPRSWVCHCCRCYRPWDH